MRKKFCKDEKLPIPVYDDPYFNYFLDLYEEHFKSKTKYSRFVEELGGQSWEDYYSIYLSFKDEVINHVKQKESYMKFISDDFSKFDFKREYNSSNKNFYVLDNVDKSWISVDLSKANFNSMKFYDGDIFGGIETYEEWIESFDGGYRFSKSKSIRQIIFGNLNPKRQQKIQKSIMNEMMGNINSLLVKDLEFHVLGADEFLLENKGDMSIEISKEVERFRLETGFEITLSNFNLLKNKEIKDFGFIKEYSSGEVEFIGVNKNLFAQAYKGYKGLEVSGNDLLFYNDGMLSKYLDIIID